MKDVKNDILNNKKKNNNNFISFFVKYHLISIRY